MDSKIKERANLIIDSFIYNWQGKRDAIESVSSTMNKISMGIEKDLDMLMMKLIKAEPTPDVLRYRFEYPRNQSIQITLSNGEPILVNTIVSEEHRILLVERSTPYNEIEKERTYSWNALSTDSKIRVYSTFLQMMKERFSK